MSAAHGNKLRSSNPLERVNREIGQRANVVGISRSNAGPLTGAMLIELNRWLVCRRYLSEESMLLIFDAATEPIVSLANDNRREDVAALAA